MSFSYHSIVKLLTAIILVSLIKLAFFVMPNEAPSPELSGQDIRQDLYALLDQIEQHSAFYALNPSKNTEQLTRLATLIAERYQDMTPNDRFAAEVAKLLNTMKDPGSQITNFEDNSGDLPLNLRPINEQWLALDTDNTPINPDFPFISHIDGLPLNKWITASQAYLPEPTKDSQEMQLPWLKKLNLLRGDLGLSPKPYVLITLVNDELQTRQETIALAPKSQRTHAVMASNTESSELTASGLLTQFSQLKSAIPPKAVYSLETINHTTVRLRIDDLYAFEQDKTQQQALIQGMEQPLLVVDLRQAQGFSPKLLSMLSHYQDASLDGRPLSQIMGFAHYRRSPEFRNDYLQPLNFKPVDTLGFSLPRLKILTQHLPNIDENKFSPWYIRTKSDVLPEGSNRLALLISPHCRQECEWIAYQTKSWSRVNLIGEKTSGDFARQYHFTLPNSGLEICFSSSLTYDAKGQLLSGNGTEPDIWLAQNSDIEWQSLVSLVQSAPPKSVNFFSLYPRLAQTH